MSKLEKDMEQERKEFTLERKRLLDELVGLSRPFCATLSSSALNLDCSCLML